MCLFGSCARKIASQSVRAPRTPLQTAFVSSPASPRTLVRKDSMRWSMARLWPGPELVDFHGRFSISGSLAMLAAIRRASSRGTRSPVWAIHASNAANAATIAPITTSIVIASLS
jgi:hypothetical protein